MSTLGSDVVAVTCIVLGGAVGAAGLSAFLDDGEEMRAEARCSSVVLTPAEAPRVVVRFRDGTDQVVAPTVRITSTGPNLTAASVDCLELRQTAAEARAAADEARARVQEARERAREAQLRVERDRREIRELVERVRAERQELLRLRESRDAEDARVR
jgi:hypothetical protein